MRTLVCLALISLSMVSCSNTTNTSSDPLRNHEALKEDRPIGAPVKSEGDALDCDVAHFNYDLDFEGAPQKVIQFKVGEEKVVRVNIKSSAPQLFSGSKALELINTPPGMSLNFSQGQWLLKWNPNKDNLTGEQKKYVQEAIVVMIPNADTVCQKAGSNLPIPFRFELKFADSEAFIQIAGLKPVYTSDEDISFNVEVNDPTMTSKPTKDRLVFSSVEANPTKENTVKNFYVSLKGAFQCGEASESTPHVYNFSCRIDKETVMKNNRGISGARSVFMTTYYRNSKGEPSQVFRSNFMINFPDAPTSTTTQGGPDRKLEDSLQKLADKAKIPLPQARPNDQIERDLKKQQKRDLVPIPKPRPSEQIDRENKESESKKTKDAKSSRGDSK